MHHLVTIAATILALTNPDAGSFKLQDSKGVAKEAHGAKASKIEPTKTEAAMKFFVVEKDKGPIKGIVIVLTSPAGMKYYTEETDADGYAETLVPVGQKYEVTYLALGRSDVAANVTVSNEPKQSVKLTLRWKKLPPPPPFVLTGIVFDTAKTTIKPESTVRLDIVADFMSHKKSAQVEIAGHTDNVGGADYNRQLSQRRASSVAQYLESRGVSEQRLMTAGGGENHPIASNSTEQGRAANRRVEVTLAPLKAG